MGVGEDSVDLHVAPIRLGHIYPQFPAAGLAGAVQTGHVVAVVVLLPAPKTNPRGHEQPGGQGLPGTSLLRLPVRDCTWGAEGGVGPGAPGAQLGPGLLIVLVLAVTPAKHTPSMPRPGPAIPRQTPKAEPGLEHKGTAGWTPQSGHLRGCP